MKRTLRRVLRWLRHRPALEQADWLWDRGRGIYEAMLRVGSDGIAVRVGGVCDVLMPPEFASGSWESYEPDVVRRLTAWLADNPRGTVLDVGCSMGILSACALAASPEAEVIAFDSDLASLKAAERLTALIGPNRLHLIFGFIDETHRSGRTFAEAEAFTRECLRASQETGNPGTTRFICLEDGADGIPSNSLDGLFAGLALPDRPTLLKIDIEGAELLALHGGRRWLRHANPTLLLSVHPPALDTRGQSAAEVRRFLEECGYCVTVFAVDHEEHWWCERERAGLAPPSAERSQASLSRELTCR
jgi:FkbM family methyltransferase